MGDKWTYPVQSAPKLPDLQILQSTATNYQRGLALRNTDPRAQGCQCLWSPEWTNTGRISPYRRGSYKQSCRHVARALLVRMRRMRRCRKRHLERNSQHNNEGSTTKAQTDKSRNHGGSDYPDTRCGAGMEVGSLRTNKSVGAISRQSGTTIHRRQSTSKLGVLLRKTLQLLSGVSPQIWAWETSKWRTMAAMFQSPGRDKRACAPLQWMVRNIPPEDSMGSTVAMQVSTLLATEVPNSGTMDARCPCQFKDDGRG